MVQEERAASAKVLGQRHIGEFETARSQRDWCGRREGLMGGENVRGKQRVLHTKAWMGAGKTKAWGGVSG